MGFCPQGTFEPSKRLYLKGFWHFGVADTFILKVANWPKKVSKSVHKAIFQPNFLNKKCPKVSVYTKVSAKVSADFTSNFALNKPNLD